MLIGNLGKDPDVQFLEGNIAVAKFPLATTETFKDRSGKLISQTEWHTVVLWRGLAELAQKYLHKGSLVYIEGRLRTRSWEDKEGNRKFATEVVGDNLIMLDKSLPDGLGIDFIEYLREHTPSAKILMISGFKAATAKDLALYNGADGFLEKPFTREQVYTTVQELLTTPSVV